jgi:2-polyprenyl-6-methoxyphenol hydroxylase-like FAD-dependent oxidoreductase
LQILENLGVSLSYKSINYSTGMGFVVFADDGNEPIQLDYPNGAMGFSCEHHLIVSTLRKAVVDCAGIDFITNALVTQIRGQQLTFQHYQQGETTILTEMIVGADGRSSLARKALGIPHKPKLVSRMAWVLLEDVELPFEGFGHVFLGGLGPTLVYRIGDNRVRMCIDVPPNFAKKSANLWDAYNPILPLQLLGAFRKTLENNRVQWVANRYSSRTCYGCPGIVLVGDAAGYFHPITATGMTIGFMDAECLVRSKSFKDYQRQRNFGTYVPEMLAMTLHQVFCRDDESAVAIRRAIYQMWRQEPQECVRTMNLLSGAQTNILHFGESFLKGLAIAVKFILKDNLSAGKWRHLIQSLAALSLWLRSPTVIALSRFYKHQKHEAGQIKAGIVLNYLKMLISKYLRDRLGPTYAEQMFPKYNTLQQSKLKQ